MGGFESLFDPQGGLSAVLQVAPRQSGSRSCVIGQSQVQPQLNPGFPLTADYLLAPTPNRDACAAKPNHDDMKRGYLMRLLFTFLLVAASLAAQTAIGGRIFEGLHDTSVAQKVTSPRLLTSDPPTCDATKREVYYNTTNNKLRVCNTANTWSDLAGGSSGTTVTMDNYYLNIGSTAYIPGMAYAATKPPASGWSWFAYTSGSSQDSAAFSFPTEGNMLVTSGAGGTGLPNILARSAGGNTTFEAAFQCNSARNFGSGSGFTGCLIGVANTTSHSLFVLNLAQKPSDLSYLYIQRYQYGATSVSGTPFSAITPFNTAQVFMKVVANAGADQITFYYSVNGVNWVQLGSTMAISDAMNEFDSFVVGVQQANGEVTTGNFQSMKFN